VPQGAGHAVLRLQPTYVLLSYGCACYCPMAARVAVLWLRVLLLVLLYVLLSARVCMWCSVCGDETACCVWSMSVWLCI
jgi:hypothetical protein